MLANIQGEFGVGTEPSLRFTPAGMAICDFRAWASKSKNVGTQQNPEWEDVSKFWTKVTAFGPLAEYVAEHVQKPGRVFITGQIEEQEWDTSTGEKRRGNNILVSAITVIGRKPESAPRKEQSTPQPAQSSDPPF